MGYLSRTYTVVVTNPPYMGAKNMSPDLSDWLGKNYPDGKSDLMTAFMLRTDSLVARSGVWAMINLPSWMSLKSFESLRSWLIETDYLITMAHLGRGVFGSDFGTVAFCIEKSAARGRQGVYRRLFERHVEVRSVARIESLYRDEDYNRFVVDQKSFTHIPGQPIVYWLSEKMRAAFAVGRALDQIAEPRQGIKTGDNDQFLRLWHEVSQTSIGLGIRDRAAAQASDRAWFPCQKGGGYRRWYGNHDFLVNWREDGRGICSFRTPDGRLRSRPQNLNCLFQQGVTWGTISTGPMSCRLSPLGFVSESKGAICYTNSDSRSEELLAILNSTVMATLLAATSPTLDYGEGAVGRLPMVETGRSTSAEVTALTHYAQRDWDSFETSWDFEVNDTQAVFRAKSGHPGA